MYPPPLPGVESMSRASRRSAIGVPANRSGDRRLQYALRARTTVPPRFTFTLSEWQLPSCDDGAEYAST